MRLLFAFFMVTLLFLGVQAALFNAPWSKSVSVSQPTPTSAPKESYLDRRAVAPTAPPAALVTPSHPKEESLSATIPLPEPKRR